MILIFRTARHLLSTTALVALLTNTGCGTVGGQAPDRSPLPAEEAPAPQGGSTAESGAAVLERANAFMATLDAGQREQLVQPYSLANAERWHTYPQWGLSGEQARLGLALGSLSASQLQAFNALLAAATSGAPNEGYDELQQHLLADDWIRANGGREGYGHGYFFVAFLGTPSATNVWQLQFGGHHLALTHSYRNGVLVGATPSFRGIEPHAEVHFNGATLRPERDEWEAFTALLASLTPQQTESARLSRLQDTLLLGPEAENKDWNFPTQSEGLLAASLSDTQRAQLMTAIGLYVNDIPKPDAVAILARYSRELDATRLAFSGSVALVSTGDYVRIDGPSLWLELVMDEPYSTDRPHVHAVWRDKRDDYGGTGRRP